MHFKFVYFALAWLSFAPITSYADPTTGAGTVVAREHQNRFRQGGSAGNHFKFRFKQQYGGRKGSGKSNGRPKQHAGKGKPQGGANKGNAGKGKPQPKGNAGKGKHNNNAGKGKPQANAGKGQPKGNAGKGKPNGNAGKGKPQANAGKGNAGKGKAQGDAATGKGKDQNGGGKGQGQNGAGKGQGNAGNNGQAQGNAGNNAQDQGNAGNIGQGQGQANGNNEQGNGNDNGQNNDPQKSLILDPRVIAKGFAQNGQVNGAAANQVPSLTSENNFINFCLTVPNFPLTDGKQVRGGSCDPDPIGVIPSTANMPSSKFVFPKNFDAIQANTPFTIELAVKNLETGNFVNAQKNYFAAPQVLNGQGKIRGHSHVVVEKLDSFLQSSPTDPNVFAFFKGLNAKAQGGKLTANVDKGLPVGSYRLASINTSANHQPCIVPVAQHGSLDDWVYFSVTDNGQQPPFNLSNGNSQGRRNGN